MLTRSVLAGLLLLVSTGWALAAQSFCSDDPSYPEPEDEGMVFYLQRSGNAKTVIYVINRLEDGSINLDDPVDIFWRFYDSDGERRELKFFERRLAFGVRYEPIPNQPGKYLSRPNADPRREIVVEQTPDGEFRAIMPVDGQLAKLKCIYVEWKTQFGIIPKIIFIDAYGAVLESGAKVVERVYP